MIGKFMAGVDKACDYIPIVSSVSNAVDVIEKIALYTLGQIDRTKQIALEAKQNDYYFKHIDNKSLWRCGFAAIPIAGNIGIGIFDLVIYVKAKVFDPDLALMVSQSASSVKAFLVAKLLVKKGVVLASNGLNQYNTNQVASCTRMAAAFLAKEADTPATSADIEAVINGVKERGKAVINEEGEAGGKELEKPNNEFEDTAVVLESFGNLEFVDNPVLAAAGLKNEPWGIDRTTISQENNIVQTIKDAGADGALITGNGITIAMRFQGGEVEFFDSHGDNSFTKGGAAAYAYRCSAPEAANFLTQKFPDLNLGVLGDLSFWPVKRIMDVKMDA